MNVDARRIVLRQRGVTRGTAAFCVALVLSALGGAVLGLEIRTRVLREARDATLAHCRALRGSERSCCLAAMRRSAEDFPTERHRP